MHFLHLVLPATMKTGSLALALLAAANIGDAAPVNNDNSVDNWDSPTAWGDGSVKRDDKNSVDNWDSPTAWGDGSVKRDQENSVDNWDSPTAWGDGSVKRDEENSVDNWDSPTAWGDGSVKRDETVDNADLPSSWWGVGGRK